MKKSTNSVSMMQLKRKEKRDLRQGVLALWAPRSLACSYYALGRLHFHVVHVTNIIHAEFLVGQRKQGNLQLNNDECISQSSLDSYSAFNICLFDVKMIRASYRKHGLIEDAQSGRHLVRTYGQLDGNYLPYRVGLGYESAQCTDQQSKSHEAKTGDSKMASALKECKSYMIRPGTYLMP